MQEIKAKLLNTDSFPVYLAIVYDKTQRYMLGDLAGNPNIISHECCQQCVGDVRLTNKK